MNAQQLEEELKVIDPRLTVVPNPNRIGLSNVKLDNIDVCPVPTENIKEQRDESYRYVFPSGNSSPHNSKSDVMQRVSQILALLETEEGKELFYAKD